MKSIVVLGAVALGLPVLACATVPVPAEQLARAEANARAAEEIGASEDPQAAYHLKLAREQIGEANRLISEGSYQRASDVLRRAEADSELALVLAREQIIRTQAEITSDQVEQLREAVEQARLERLLMEEGGG